MSSFTVQVEKPRAQHVVITDDHLVVELTDGRTISVPLAWYPRLLCGTRPERNHWRLIGNGEGIHWPDLDEDLSIENLISGRPSGESQLSLKRWLEARKSPKKGNQGAPRAAIYKVRRRAPRKAGQR